MNRMFASDNSAPACPAVLQEMETVNGDHVFSYGADPVSRKAVSDLAELFGLNPEEIIVALVPNGTAANVIGLSTFLRQWDGVIGGPESHITEDECGALEGVRGIKIYHVPHNQGKISPDVFEMYSDWNTNIHRNNPRAISITQSTELGTVYSIGEIKAFGRGAAKNEMILHVDGARLSNGVVAQWMKESGGTGNTNNPPPLHQAQKILRQMTVENGVGVVSLGATKNGGLSCDALVIFPKNLPAWALQGEAAPWPELRIQVQRSQKQALGLLSKYRYAAAQISALFASDVWVLNAYHANIQAKRLADGIQEISRKVGNRTLGLLYPVEANGLWVSMPQGWVEALQKDFGFYVWTPERAGENKHPVIRLMTSWDTSDGSVDALIGAIEKLA